MKKKSFSIGLFYAGVALMACMAVSCSKDDVQINSNPSSRLKAVTLPSIPSGTFNITSYGASTGSSNNTTAVQNAINAAFVAGGGTVVVPSGTFMCGPVKLKNNVGLQLSSGSTLKVLAYENYPGSGTTADVDPFIDLRGLTNVLVSGSGTIEGQGLAWWNAYTTSKAAGAAIARPGMIGLETTTTAAITGIKIQNAPNNHIGIGKNGNSITVSGVTISSPSNSPNTDGIGVWSPNVDITNCNISCGDDNIAINSNSKYVTITGCTFGAGHGCSIGSYASNIDHITVDNCTFNGTGNGIRVKSNRTRSGDVQYLTYSNLTMTNVPRPVFICAYYPDNTIPSSPSADPAQTITSTTPNFKHITLKNIIATGASDAGIIWGLPEQAISDIVFDNVTITANIGMKANFVSGAVFKNGSKITVSSGNAFVSTYNSTISGINLTTGQPSSSSSIISGAVYSIIAKHSGKGLDVQNASTANGGNIQQWNYVGAANQKFRITNVDGEYYSIININSNKSLDVANQSTSNGANIQQWNYVGAANQQFKFVSTGDGYYQIVNRNSGKCLDVLNLSTSNGANVQQYTCGSGANQRWQLNFITM